MIRADYLAALHAAFDARRDPLDVAAVRAWLAEHPEDLTEFAAMRAALAPSVDSGARPAPAAAQPRRTLWPMAFPPLAAAAALLLFLTADRTPAPDLEPSPTAWILAASRTETIEPAADLYAPVEGAGVLATSVSYSRTITF